MLRTQLDLSHASSCILLKLVDRLYSTRYASESERNVPLPVFSGYFKLVKNRSISTGFDFYDLLKS